MFAHEKLGLMLLFGTLGLAIYLLVHHMIVTGLSGKKLDQTKSRDQSHQRM
jgi:hypothetical protein